MELTELYLLDTRIDPHGPIRQDLNAGIVSSLIYNANRGKGKAMSPADFMPKFEQKDEQKLSVEETQKLLQGLANGWNKSRKKK